MPGNHNDIEKRLWDAADELRANSKLKASEYSTPVLGLIFLRFADHKFTEFSKSLQPAASSRRTLGPADFKAKGVLYLPNAARFSTLLNLPEGANLGKAINDAMKAIEEQNEDLKGILPRNYNNLENSTLAELLKLLNSIAMDIEGDVFGKIYEYFLGEFALAEGRGGGEFFTPTAIVKLIVEIIEPFHGRIYDPACGSGGMFVQSARFVESHKKRATAEIMAYGQEKEEATVKLCKMNLAVHGLSGDIRQAISYYEDLHKSPGRFDFVMANPQFNVDRVDKERIKDDRSRFPLGMPTADNANYLWIQLFYSSLNEKGRAGFVMANSASDARGSELALRKTLFESGAVDVMAAIGPSFFYTVPGSCTLWFLDKGKTSTDRKGKILFIDAHHIYRQIDRAHRDFTPEQIEFLANIVRMYRGEEPEYSHGSELLIKEKFPSGRYADVAGLCKVASPKEIEAQGWSLNPGRYVGVGEQPLDDSDFFEKIEELSDELSTLNAEANELQGMISRTVASLLDFDR
ncbi:MAG: type I restriction-modification system subunit M [bacterium]